MSLNKYMHPRNIYKQPPDFAKLAKCFEDFSNITKADITGKLSIDFKDPHSLRILTKCLLKADFDLDVVIPEDRLVPTLPLRLNYILWIEDLMASIDRKDEIKGLDIGTGSCAIYPLLGAVKNKWYMLGTESNEESLRKAQENIDRNNLQNVIKLSMNPTSTLIDYLFKEDKGLKFDFCMCNPPFYSSIQELHESRSPARLPPKNGFTGSPHELITEGGELAFCMKMIEESKKFEDKILIYTTMVGHKHSLKELIEVLNADGIRSTNTEFCQGRVTRWGLAWTFQDFDLCKLVPAREKLRKKSLPIVYRLSPILDREYDFETVKNKLLHMLQELKLNCKVLNKRGNFLLLDVKAAENTWSNQRRKRRMLKQCQESNKKSKIDSELISAEVNVDNANPNNKETCQDINININNNELTEKDNDIKFINESNKQHENAISESVECSGNNIESNETKSTSTENDIKNILIHAFFKLLQKGNEIFLEMEFLSGTLGKEGLHQILQYIKNKWKYIVVFLNKQSLVTTYWLNR